MTSLGMPVRSIAKYPYWGKLDLWADGVAPMLGVDLCVQTWQNNGSNLGAFCKRDGRAFNVIDVGGMQFSSDTRWDNVKDHSKWAVSDACTAAADALWVCIGDINRQSGQFSRGGGAMCFQSRPLYESFYSFISPLASNCSGNLSKCAIPLPSGTIPLSAARVPLGPLYHAQHVPRHTTYNMHPATQRCHTRADGRVFAGGVQCDHTRADGRVVAGGVQCYHTRADGRVQWDLSRTDVFGSKRSERRLVRNTQTALGR
jgi:hypothetical protein